MAAKFRRRRDDALNTNTILDPPKTHLEILKKTNRWSYRDRAATGAMTAVTRQPQRRPTRHKRRHANWSWMKRPAVTAASSSGK